MKKRFIGLTLLLLGAGANISAQHRSVDIPHWVSKIGQSWDAYHRHNTLYAAYKMEDTFSWVDTYLPMFEQEREFILALSSAKSGSSSAEQMLLYFIEKHPQSASTLYAKVALGEYYFSKENYRSAAYWLAFVDRDYLPEDLSERTSYYLAYSLMKDRREDSALTIFAPLVYSKKYSKEASFYAGYISFQKGDYPASFKYFRPIENDSFYGLYVGAYEGEMLLEQGKYSEALPLAERTMKKSGDREAVASAYRVAGLSAAQLSLSRKALEYLSSYVSMTDVPGRLELLTLGQEQYKLELYSEAIGHFNRVADGTNDYMSQLALYYKGLSALSSGKLQDAYDAFVKSSQIEVYLPLVQAAEYNSAMILYNEHPGDIGVGTEALGKFVSKHPLSEYQDKAVSYLVDAYGRTTDHVGAIKEIDKITPLPKELARLRQKITLSKANKLLGTGNVVAAKKEYDEIITSNGDAESVAEAYLWKGELLHREGNYGDAIRSIQTYIQMVPRGTAINPIAYYNLGYSFFNLERWSEAREAFRDYLSFSGTITESDQTNAYNRLGDISMMQREYDSAFSSYTSAIAKGGKDADYAILKRAHIMGLRKNYQGKAAELESLVEKYPNSPYIHEALYEKGRALTFVENNIGARAEFTKVFSGYPDSDFAPKAGVQLALSYFNDNDLNKAADIYAEVIKRYPNSGEAKSALQDLKSISVRLDRVEEYSKLAQLVDQSTGSRNSDETESLTFLAAERLISQGKHREALDAMKRYVERYPNGSFRDQAEYHQAYILYKEKRYKEALPILIALERKNNTAIQGDVLKMLAQTYEQLGDYDTSISTHVQLARRAGQNKKEVESALFAALEIAERGGASNVLRPLAKEIELGRFKAYTASAPVLNHVAKGLVENREYQDALGFTSAAIKLDGSKQTLSVSQVLQAEAQFGLGQIAVAKKNAEAYIEKGYNNSYWIARAFILLADIAIKQGDKNLALEYLNGVKSNHKPAKNDDILSKVEMRLSSLK
ncbi:MAG: tetratricopeptide repeat protein [Porphyromonas sp.]|nr:tetratricopeptide repeat protein [Porphyromonas sp.]